MIEESNGVEAVMKTPEDAEPPKKQFPKISTGSARNILRRFSEKIPTSQKRENARGRERLERMHEEARAQAPPRPDRGVPVVDNRAEWKMMGTTIPAWEPSDEKSPIPSLGEESFEGFEDVDMVDLRALDPGDLVYFSGTSELAQYALKIGEQGDVTAWRRFDTEYEGLKTSSVDEIAAYDAKSRGKEGMGHVYAQCYPGMLFKPGYLGMDPGFHMPMINYDGVKTKKPTGIWADAVVELKVKKASHEESTEI